MKYNEEFVVLNEKSLIVSFLRKDFVTLFVLGQMNEIVYHDLSHLFIAEQHIAHVYVNFVVDSSHMNKKNTNDCSVYAEHCIQLGV